jgi:hypothetical protein
MAIAAVTAVAATLAGTLLGLLAGFVRPLEAPLMRLVDAMMALPDLLLAIALVAILGPSAWTVVLALSLVYTPRVARVVRASTLVVRELPFIEAARALGMSQTVFRNASGLPNSEQVTTARDLSLLASALIRDFPEYYKKYYSMKEFRYNNITQANRNRLLWLDPTVDGVKTGFTDNAGYCLITSARRGDRRLVSVVLGTASESARATESQKLLNWGFQFYDSVKLYGRNQPVTQLRVWKGASDMLKAGFTNDLYIALPKGQNDRIKATVESLQPLLALEELLPQHSLLSPFKHHRTALCPQSSPNWTH